MQTSVASGAQMELKSAFNYTQPSLPHLLTEYGFTGKATDGTKKAKDADKEPAKTEKKEKKKKKKTDSFDDAEDERELEKQRERDEHYEQLVRDMYRLRDYYYMHYSNLLSEKIQKQRRERREKEKLLQTQKEKEADEQRKASHTVKKRLQRHDLDTIPAQQHMPKTDLYHIVGLEDKLRREGKLKTSSDYDKFRREIQQPHVFYANFKVNKHTDFTQYPSSSIDHQSIYSRGESHDSFSMSDVVQGQQQQQQQHLPPQPQQQRSLSRISECQEQSRPGTRQDTWAVTQQYRAYQKPRRSITGLVSKPPKADAQSDLEKRFPKLEMPKLHCFNMNLANKPPDPDEVLRQTSLKEKEKQRKTMARTKTKMYQLAMSNAAIAARILDQQEDIDMMFSGPDLCDVIADHHWMDVYGLTELNVPAVPPETSLMPEERQIVIEEEEEAEDRGDIKEITLPEIEEREQSAVSDKRTRSSSARSKRSVAEEATPMPLTMSEIKDNCSIVEAKTLSTLWTNYLQAGK